MLQNRSHDYKDSVSDLILAFSELKQLAHSLFSGKLSFHDEKLWAVCNMISRGRPFHNPYNDSINRYLLSETNTMYSIKFMDMALQASLTEKSFHDCKKDRERILDHFTMYREVLCKPLKCILATQIYNTKKKKTHAGFVCSHCWYAIFPADINECRSQYRAHTCTVGNETFDERFIWRLDDDRVSRKLHEWIETLDEDQKNCFFQLTLAVGSDKLPNILINGA
jgi:hypothetical protein